MEFDGRCSDRERERCRDRTGPGPRKVDRATWVEPTLQGGESAKDIETSLVQKRVGWMIYSGYYSCDDKSSAWSRSCKGIGEEGVW